MPNGRCSALPSGLHRFCSGNSPELYWFFPSLGPSQLHREVDTAVCISQRLLIFLTKPWCKLERALQRCRKTPTQHVMRQFTGSKLRLIGVRRSAWVLVRRWEKPAQLHWVATVRLKLGSPQPVRCRPVNGCLLY